MKKQNLKCNLRRWREGRPERVADEEGFPKPAKMSGTATGTVRRAEEYVIICQTEKVWQTPALSLILSTCQL